MAPEISQPDVEETTEPPIRSSTYDEPASFLQSTVDPIVVVKEQPSVPAGDCPWTDQYQYAHTFAALDIARVLVVDVQ